MHKIIGLGLATALVLAASASADGQPLSSQILTGNEAWVGAIGGPGGSGLYITTAEIRNATGYSLVSATSGTVAATTLAARYIFTAALSGGVALTTPANPFDGQMLEIINGTGLAFTSTITLTASGSQTVVAPAVVNLVNATSAEWQYLSSTTTWVRLR